MYFFYLSGFIQNLNLLTAYQVTLDNLVTKPKTAWFCLFYLANLELVKYFISLFLNKVWLLTQTFLIFFWKSCDIWKQSYKSFKDRKLPLEQFPGLKTVFWSIKTIFLNFGLQNPVHEILLTAPLFFKNS